MSSMDEILRKQEAYLSEKNEDRDRVRVQTLIELQKQNKLIEELKAEINNTKEKVDSANKTIADLNFKVSKLTSKMWHQILWSVFVVIIWPLYWFC